MNDLIDFTNRYLYKHEFYPELPYERKIGAHVDGHFSNTSHRLNCYDQNRARLHKCSTNITMDTKWSFELIL